MNETLDVAETLVASLIDAMPEPVLVVSEAVRLIARQWAGAGAVSNFAAGGAARLQPAGGRSA